MALSFEGKIVVVTGGNSGIGAACVAIFAAQGARVANLDLAATAANPSSGDDHLYVQCDVSSNASVVAAIDTVLSKFSRIDILVNNAGVMDDFSKTADVTDESWSKLMGVNLNGPFYMLRAVISHMLKNETTAAPDALPTFDRMGQPGPPRAPSKGAIVNVCSAAAKHGATAGTAYTTSKHALLGLSRSTAWMYRNDGIRCNSVLPGGTATNIYQNSKVSMNQEGYAATQPYQNCMFGSISMPTGIANAIVYLAGSVSEGINGAELAVDDAWTTA